jgi:hypothetical protein
MNQQMRAPEPPPQPPIRREGRSPFARLPRIPPSCSGGSRELVTTDEDRVAERTAEWLGIALPVETPLFSGRRPDRFRKATEREATPQSAKRVEKGLVLPQEGMNRTSCLAGAPRRPQHLGTPGAPVRTAKLHPAEKSASQSAIREHLGNHERHIVKLRSTVNESADLFHEAVVDLHR